MTCVNCGFAIHECICRDCVLGEFTIIPSSVGNRLYFDLERKDGTLLCTYYKDGSSFDSSSIKQGIMEAKQAFRDRGYNI